MATRKADRARRPGKRMAPGAGKDTRPRKVLAKPPAGSDTGPFAAGRGRVDVTGITPEGIRVDPGLTEGHPGYQESGGSEIIPNARFAQGGRSSGKKARG